MSKQINKAPLTLKLTVTGHTTGDLVTALQEVLGKVESGYIKAFDRNDTGSFSFDVDGEEVTEYALIDPLDNVSEDRFDTPDEAQSAAAEHGGVVVGLNEFGTPVYRAS